MSGNRLVATGTQTQLTLMQSNCVTTAARSHPLISTFFSCNSNTGTAVIPDGLSFLSFGGSLTDVDGSLTDPRTDAVYRFDEDTREFVMMEYR